jgi:hypothetical protein
MNAMFLVLVAVGSVEIRWKTIVIFANARPVFSHGSRLVYGLVFAIECSVLVH